MKAYLDGKKGTFEREERKVEMMLMEINLGEKGYQWRKKQEGIERKQSDRGYLNMEKELDETNGFQEGWLLAFRRMAIVI